MRKRIKELELKFKDGSANGYDYSEYKDLCMKATALYWKWTIVFISLTLIIQISHMLYMLTK